MRRRTIFVGMGLLVVLVAGIGIAIGVEEEKDITAGITQCDLMDLHNLAGDWVRCGGDDFFYDNTDTRASGLYATIIDYGVSVKALEHEEKRLAWEQWRFNQTVLLEEGRTAAINRLAEAVENMPDTTPALMEMANATREAASQSNVSIVW